MKVVLDACVLYPSVMRAVLLGAAKDGLYQPFWSARILGEWARAAEKLGPEGAAQARAEVAVLRALWPGAELPAAPGVEARLWLPDPADVHVLAVAVAGSADAIVTLNARDFPRHILRGEGVDRVDPDGFLMTLWQNAPAPVEAAVAEVLEDARQSNPDWTVRALLKKARLPRLAKALADVSG
ncbi:MAG: RSP_2648 family PIN domain-containing protein [Marinibacterium sp.]